MNASLFSETCGAFAPVKLYRAKADGKSLSVENKSPDYDGLKDRVTERQSTNQLWTQTIKLSMRQIFLPNGYPQSVSSDYIPYQIWDTVQAFASSITGALATEAVMKGVGVGDDKATALAAALTWLLKSGSGMIGNIIFAWYKGTSLDHDCKKWRLFADVLNDIAIFIDLINPLFPSRMVVIVLCLSSVFRSLVGVAGGATRAAITQHQARNNNMADVSAKDGSQETLVNLLALITSLIVLPLVSGKSLCVWTLFFLFTFIHLFANFRAVKTLQMETLNISRLLICADEFFRSKTIPSVKEVNSKESVIIGRGLNDVNVCDFNINLGFPLDKALSEKRLTKDNLLGLIENSHGKPFIIIPNAEQKQINVILQYNITASDIIEVYFRCIAIAAVDSEKFLSNLLVSDAMDTQITSIWLEFRQTVLNKGFVIDRALIPTGDWRAKWKLQ